MKCYLLVDECLVESDMEHWKGPVRLGDITVRGLRVSTVFLGIEHDGGMFETMIFGTAFNGALDQWQARRETYKESQELHEHVVKAIKKLNWLEWHLDGNAGAKLLEKIG